MVNEMNLCVKGYSTLYLWYCTYHTVGCFNLKNIKPSSKRGCEVSRLFCYFFVWRRHPKLYGTRGTVQ